MEQVNNTSTLEFVCEQCKRTFTKKSKLSRHVRESHLNIKTFNCNLCNKTFKRNSHLKRHMISHSEEPKPFKCNQCSMQFSCKHHLERHIKTLHAEDFPFQCDICLLRFPKRACLFKHLTFIHNLKKPHKCCDCEKDFFKNGQLIRHLKRVHPNSYHAQQQLLNAHEYQIQQRIQANLSQKSDNNQKEKFISNATNTQDSHHLKSYPNNENNLYSEVNNQQNNSATATCYYYSLESQIQNLNNLFNHQPDQQQCLSSATSVISFSSSSYPSSNPTDAYDQSQVYYKNMIDRYYNFDEIYGDEYDEEEEEYDEESDDMYKYTFNQLAEAKLNKKIDFDDDDYLVSAHAMNRLPQIKEKKIKKSSKISSSQMKNLKGSHDSALSKVQNNKKNEDLYMLDNNCNNPVHLEEIPTQIRKFSEEIFSHLNVATVGLMGCGNNSVFGNANNTTADEDHLALQQSQQHASFLENHNNSSNLVKSCSGTIDAVNCQDNNNEKKILCSEALIFQNNVAQQQKQQYNSINNNQNTQSYIYYNNDFSQQKHEKEQQQSQQEPSSSTITHPCQIQETGYGVTASKVGIVQNNTISCAFIPPQQSTQSLNMCYVPSSMQQTQNYQKQLQQIQTQQQVPTTTSFTTKQNQQQQQLSVQTQSSSVKNEDTILPYQQSYSLPLHSTISYGNGFPCPFDSCLSGNVASTLNKNDEEGYFIQGAENSLSFLNNHYNTHSQNEINIDFLNLFEFSQQHQQNNNQNLMNSDIIQVNSYMDKILTEYSQKNHYSTAASFQQPQIKQVIKIPLINLSFTKEFFNQQNFI